MNSMAMSFAALILSGVKSLASILVDTSIASTMSMPSVSILSIWVDDLGRAMATIIIDKATVLRIMGICLIMPSTEGPPASHGPMPETLR